jgi:hypothetical protein
LSIEPETESQGPESISLGVSGLAPQRGLFQLQREPSDWIPKAALPSLRETAFHVASVTRVIGVLVPHADQHQREPSCLSAQFWFSLLPQTADQT